MADEDRDIQPVLDPGEAGVECLLTHVDPLIALPVASHFLFWGEKCGKEEVDMGMRPIAPGMTVGGSRHGNETCSSIINGMIVAVSCPDSPPQGAVWLRKSKAWGLTAMIT